MSIKNTWSAINKPEEVFNDLIELAGQWNIPFDIKINAIHQISDGPIGITLFETSGEKRKPDFT